MCGINGFTWPDEKLVRAMNEKTRNRGPDDAGVLVDEHISLGHCRLSIIDLSPKGHQPMSNEDGTVWIVFNGEIYNFQELREKLVQKGHIFKSKTDTEVIIHSYEEWGTACFDMFNGMWAFCIYDRKKGELILSRDRFGIKPLYYYIDDRGLVFSSMISAILCHNVKTRPNDKAIMQFLAYNLAQHDANTFFENIYTLLPGHFLKWDLRTKNYSVTKWYSPKVRSDTSKEAVRNAFIESVRIHTVADVPIGSCLSGGLDSSAIVCVLNRFLNYPFYTFSFAVPDTPVDETKYVLEVGRQTNTKQFFTRLYEDEFLEEVEDFVISLEEPVAGLSPYAQYRVMKLAHEQGAKVLLDGQGGDEIFAGYVYYFSYRYWELLRRLKILKLLREMALYVHNFKNFYPIAMFGFTLLPRKVENLLWRTVLNNWVNYELLQKLCGEENDPRWDRIPLNDALRLTLFSTAIPHLLCWEDKNSMRWSIESRVPFLEVNLVETALSQPPEAKLRDGRTKVTYKEAVEGILPPMIFNRKDKIGFAAPAKDLLRSPKVADFCRDIFFSESFKNRPYWKWEKVTKKLSEHIEGKKNHEQVIWKCLNLELWLRAFFS
jgi:asparagine synthase (glutamine-hydrolysing)